MRSIDSSPAPDTAHWAYQQGRTAGLAGNTTERGIMAFGLGCAADASTSRNTRLWLAGFDAGAVEQAEARKQTQAPVRAYVDDGTRRFGPSLTA